jgi:hypothetical protein
MQYNFLNAHLKKWKKLKTILIFQSMHVKLTIIRLEEHNVDIFINTSKVLFSGI